MMARTTRALVGATALAAVGLALAAPATASNPGWDGFDGNADYPDAAPEEFVTVHGTHFDLDGQLFQPFGSNNYYPMYESQAMVDNLFETASEAGFNTMRVWGFFAIGSPGGGDRDTLADGDKGVPFQYWDDAAGAPAFNDGADGLERLDYVVAKAKEEGIRLVLPLTNNWTAFGGMDQYNEWAGNEYHSDFYTSELTREWYRDWIEHLLERENTYTGVKYKDEPAIMAWELANEPRCIGDGGPADGSWGSGLFPRDPDCTAETITPWIEEMSAHIKSFDANHLVAVGDEGFFADSRRDGWQYDGTDGVDTVAWASVEDIDYGSYHLYPDHWDTDAAWGTQWIADHNAVQDEIGKPMLMGEFGWHDLATRNTVYKEWLDEVQASGGPGALFWILSDERDDGTLYPDYDGFTVYCPGTVCTTIQNAQASLAGEGWWKIAPVADHDAVEVPFGSGATVDVTANDVAYQVKINPRTVDLDPSTPHVQERTATVPGGTATANAATGEITVVPDEGFSGQITVPYTVRSQAWQLSNVANVVVTVAPDPNAALVIEDFEDGASGWYSFGGTSVTADDGEGVFANATGGWDWTLLTLPEALDLSDKDVVRFDFVGTDSGVNPEMVFKVGSGWTWCQIALDEGIWNTPAAGEEGPSVTLSRLTPECQAGLTQVHEIGIGTQSGTHRFDNLIAN